MRVDTFDIIAPALSAEPWSEAAVLGSATWLWMHSKAHREAPLHSLATQRLQLVAGMPAEVLLKVGERSLLSYLTQPAGNLFARALIED